MPDTKEEVLKAAIAGLPRVVDAILAAPADAQSSMLAAVEDSYRKVARDLGYADSDVQNWVEQLMFRLRSEVTARRPPERKDPDVLAVDGTLYWVGPRFRKGA